MSATALLYLLKIYLLAGLVFHKGLWEYLKRRGNVAVENDSAPLPLKTRLVKAVKLLILGGIIAQTAVPFDMLPVSDTPLTIRLTGLVIFSLGLLTAVIARLQLGNNWSDIEEGNIADEHAVVSHGIYGYIRHPIYTGDILLLTGLELCLNSWLVLGVLLLAPVVALQAVREERKLMSRLPGYPDYARRTKRFIPFVV